MRQHPRIRRIAKCAGFSLCVALLGTMAMSFKWAVGFDGAKAWFGVAAGGFVVTVMEDALPVSQGGSCERIPMSIRTQFRAMVSLWIRSWPGPGATVHYVPLYLPMLAIAGFTTFLWRRDRRIQPGHCRCGYNLTGNVSGVCPECGTPCKPVQ